MPKEPFALKIDEELMTWIREQASKDNRSVNNWIETALIEYKKIKEE